MLNSYLAGLLEVKAGELLRVEILEGRRREVRVPVTALFRDDGGWAVYRVENGTVHLQRVEAGRWSGLEAEVKQGLEAGQEEVLNPGDTIKAGVAVKAKTEG